MHFFGLNNILAISTNTPMYCTMYKMQIVHSTIHTCCIAQLLNIDCTLYIVQCTLYSIVAKCKVYILQCMLYSVVVKYRLYIVHYTLYSVHCTLYNARCTAQLLIVDCTFFNIRCIVQLLNIHRYLVHTLSIVHSRIYVEKRSC